MKALVVYDSMFGNTEKVAKILTEGLEEGGVDVECVKVDAVNFDRLGDVDLLAVGSPTHAWNTSESVKQFLDRLKNVNLSGKKAFAFDTKMKSRLAGSGAGKIEAKLKSMGMIIAKPHASAIVKGREGPLDEGFEERFRQVGVELAKTI